MNNPGPELSRRAALCIDASMFADNPQARADFIAALEKAPTFNDLPAKVQQQLLAAEKQIANERGK